jgi:hypothetical protein
VIGPMPDCDTAKLANNRIVAPTDNRRRNCIRILLD